jgi:signal transduction histidine kinase
MTQSRKTVDVKNTTSKRVLLVNGDKTHMLLAFKSLIHNAIDFTPHGGMILISISESNGEIRISVQDSGPGVDDVVRSQLFQASSQLIGDNLICAQGCGVGMNVSRRIVHLHGGSLELDESAIDEVSRTSMRLGQCIKRA